MTLVKESIWKDTDDLISEPDLVAELMRAPNFSNGQLNLYLEELTKRSGQSFPHLARLARYGLVFQKGHEHLETRRAIAPFFTVKAIATWEPVADRAIHRAVERLKAADEPDLIRDFCAPAFLEFFQQFVGCNPGDEDRLLELINMAVQASTPMLSLRVLKQIEQAFAELRGAFPAGTDAPPGSFLAFLDGIPPLQIDDWQPVDLALSVLVGGATLPQSTGFILYRLLLDDLATWHSVAAPGWAEQSFDELVALYPSGRTLVRIAEAPTVVKGCPYHTSDAARLDTSEANYGILKRDGGSAKKHLSFGYGAHKCPGTALSRMFIGRAIPALAKAFPGLALQRNKVLFHRTKLVQHPLTLPCILNNRSVRKNTRLVEICDLHEARAIVNDDSTWAPPQMEPYLKALSARSGRDTDTALKIARNAMFFMSGPRHAEIRLAAANSLGGNRLRDWQPLIEAEVEVALDQLAQTERPDLINQFAEPLFRQIAQPILGINSLDQARFDAVAPVLQDVLEPWLPLRELDRMQDVFAELLEILAPPRTEGLPAVPLLVHLAGCDLKSFDETDLKSFVLVLYGASFNLSHTLGNILHHLLTLPPSRRVNAGNSAWITQELEGLISLCASPKYIYRMARKPASVGDIAIAANETLRLQLLQINRGTGTGHLAFGHGLHRCIGAALTKQVLRAAIPAFFARFPDARLRGQNREYHGMSQTVALASLPCRLDPLRTKENS